VILKIAIIVVTIIAAVLIFAATRPNTIRVQRSITINAPAEKIFPFLNDFHDWNRWAPQDKEDPTMTRTYSGAANGKGAVSDWDSKGNAGKGRMTIIESSQPTHVVVQVDFVRPFAAHNVNEFILEPGSSTRVTWTMQGSRLYIMKVMGIFVNMDRVMGKHFEAGLTNLKSAAEI
jgi:carbon monoxide dehydrogenase subunit G